MGVATLLAVACAGESDTLQPLSLPPATVLATSDDLTRIVDVAFDSTSTLWVLNGAQPFVVAFDLDGRVQKAWGTRGGGPAEFLSPSSLLRSPDGSVWVFDVARQALVRARVNGADDAPARRPVRIERPLLSMEASGVGPGRPWLRIRRSDPEALLYAYADGSDGTDRLWRAKIGQTGGEPVLLDIGAVVGARSLPAQPWFGPHPLWDQCESGAFAVFDPRKNVVLWIDPVGGVRVSRSLPVVEEVPVTPERLFRVVFLREREYALLGGNFDSASVATALKADLSQMDLQIAETFPKYVDLRCEEGDAAWLNRFDYQAAENSRSTDWLLVRPHDAPALVRMPPRFRPFDFEKGRVWGRSLDSLDIASVAWVRIPN